ncbi:2-iminobutanoate/2-iminopropanoate deaminase [Haloactinopolyspora alba]|uniref:2-iminobutanoate/2-iminopropanoate deaminase n=1 Tax=Haloactinopolyspora alba TaxID=648780 RepID=A0A2P8DT28_9ACTN|nr:Rid family hydrolase [Haloactinopolyspora alba]PSL00369.1 2-iminobutanoate/2-iminopropanoate deaminase [Haloactinopolyspora alba]
MTKNALVIPNLPAPAGPYSQIVEAGGFVYTAGFGPQDPQSGAVPEGVAAQTEQVITNLQTALEAVGLSLDAVVKTTVHLEHLDRDVAEYNRVYAQRFAEPYPVRTTVGSTLANILVEIDAVAVKP